MTIRAVLEKSLRPRGIRLVDEINLGLAAGEVYLARLFREFRFDFVFDVGANAGQYALKLINELEYAGRILSIEPVPSTIHSLQAAMGSHRGWSCLQCALDRQDGIAEFNVMAGSQFSSLLAPQPEFAGSFEGKTRVAETISVPVRTLDSVFDDAAQTYEFTKPFVKLDTQGTELRILEGAQRALRRFMAVQIEVSFTTIYDGAPDFHRIFEFMSASGFGLSGLFPNNQGHFPRVLEMDAVFVRRDLLPAVERIR